MVSDYMSMQDDKPLKFWITERWLSGVQLEGCTVNDLGIAIPCNSWNPGPGAECLYGT